MEILLLLIVLYFLPSVIASARQHNEKGTIFMANLFLGWTGIVWFIVLIWSMTGNTKLRRKTLTDKENT